jgi:heme exporter protein D
MSHAIILLGIVLLFFLHFETINWYQVGLTIFAIAVYIVHDVYSKRDRN